LILPAWKGIDNEAKNAAIELEKQGYIAFVADIYGEGNIPADNAAAARNRRTIQAGLQSLSAKGFLLLWKN
jgi:dienelactone hydrolase